MEKFWTNVLTGCGILALIISGVVFFTAILSSHNTLGYYLYTGDGVQLKIFRNIDWQIDEKVMVLDRQTTYDQAVELVNKLNSTIKNPKP